MGTEAPYNNKYGTGAAGDGYAAPNAGYREPGYAAATTGAGAAGARDSYPATGASGARDSGYRTPTTGGAYHPELMQPGEVPARDYLNNSVHTNY